MALSFLLIQVSLENQAIANTIACHCRTEIEMDKSAAGQDVLRKSIHCQAITMGEGNDKKVTESLLQMKRPSLIDQLGLSKVPISLA
jgi:hypothetical protein